MKIEENEMKTNDVEEKPPFRQIIIETDGNDIHLVKAEVGGKIELIGVLQNLITFLINQK